MQRLACLGVIVLAACAPIAGSPSPATSSPQASAPANIADRLLAVIEGPPCVSAACQLTVAIAGLDGQIRAKAVFQQAPHPSIGCEGSYIVAPVQVAAGSVYFLDATGLVRRLSPSGVVQDVARFPILTSQQPTWFAVSPDGTQLMASIVAYPPLESPQPSPQGCPQHAPGDVVQQLYIAAAGGATTALASSSPQPVGKYGPQHTMAMVGWDHTGPVATTDTYMAYIGYVDGTVWLGPAAHLDSQGHPGPPIGGPDCNPGFGELPDGTLICFDPQKPTVRDTAGNILWSLTPIDPANNQSYGTMALSPDAQHVAFSMLNNMQFVDGSSVIVSRDGVRTQLGLGFEPQGWLDAQTVIGQHGSMQATCSGCTPQFVPSGLAVVHVQTPTKIEDLGFQGFFQGAL